MSYIVTYSGHNFDYGNIQENKIDLYDILHSLTRINRFVGHSIRPYSVAEHSLNCLTLSKELKYSKREQMLVLIHDFTEAYVGDCPSPLKELLPEYLEIEKKVERVIFNYFGLSPMTDVEHTKVKFIDRLMLIIEMRELTRHNDAWRNLISDDRLKIAMQNIDISKLSLSKSYEPREIRLILMIANELNDIGESIQDLYGESSKQNE